MSATILAIMFTATSIQFELPRNLLTSLCYVESNHNPKAIHKDDGNSNSVGVCQVKLSTARSLGFKGTEKQLLDPETNIYYSAKYLKYQLLRYKNNSTNAIIAYNRGNAKGLTRTKYSDKVIQRWRINNERCKENSCGPRN